jgi:hypothetical protein
MSILKDGLDRKNGSVKNQQNILFCKPGVQRALEDGILMGRFKNDLMFMDLHWINMAEVGCCGHVMNR